MLRNIDRRISGAGCGREKRRERWRACVWRLTRAARSRTWSSKRARTCRLYKASTTPHEPADGILDAFALAAADAGREPDDFLGSAELFIHGTTRAINAILTGDDGAHGALCHARATRTCCCSARAGAPNVQLQLRLPGPVHAARADVRDRRADRRQGRGRAAAGRGRAVRDRCAAARRSASRRSPSACCGRSSTRRTSCASASCSTAPARRPVHALARLNPMAARVPPGVLGRDRRVAEAADDEYLATSSGACARRASAGAC